MFSPLIGDTLPWPMLLARARFDELSTNSSNTGVRGRDSESLLDDVDVLFRERLFNGIYFYIRYSQIV